MAGDVIAIPERMARDIEKLIEQARDSRSSRHRAYLKRCKEQGTEPKREMEENPDWENQFLEIYESFWRDERPESTSAGRIGQSELRLYGELRRMILFGSNIEAIQMMMAMRDWKPESAPKKVLKAYQENGAKKGEVPPFFSEVFLYEVLGKEDARTLLSFFGRVLTAFGLREWDQKKDSEAAMKRLGENCARCGGSGRWSECWSQDPKDWEDDVPSMIVVACPDCTKEK